MGKNPAKALDGLKQEKGKWGCLRYHVKSNELILE
jgi:hypothetical protein